MATPRRPRTVALALAVAATAVSVVLAVTVSLWFLVAVPYTGIAGYACWSGLSNEELFEALEDGNGDGGMGAPGVSP